MNNLKQAAEQALEALEATSSYDIPPTSQVRSATTALRTALEQQAEPNIKQIAEALRQHGLSLVKTTDGYDVMKLGPVTAHNLENT